MSKVKRVSDGQILVWKELNYGKMNDKEKQKIVLEVNILRGFLTSVNKLGRLQSRTAVKGTIPD